MVPVRLHRDREDFPILRVNALGPGFQVHLDSARWKTHQPAELILLPSGDEVKALIELEQDHILQVLRKTGWRIEGNNGAALLLGLNPSTLRARIRKYGIHRQ